MQMMNDGMCGRSTLVVWHDARRSWSGTMLDGALVPVVDSKSLTGGLHFYR